MPPPHCNTPRPYHTLLLPSPALPAPFPPHVQYQDAQKPSFQVMEVPGARPQDPVQYRATVICPAVHRGPGDLAFEDIMFEVCVGGVGWGWGGAVGYVGGYNASVGWWAAGRTGFVGGLLHHLQGNQIVLQTSCCDIQPATGRGAQQEGGRARLL